MKLRAIAALALSAALIWGIPLLALVAAGQSAAPYLAFPPRTLQVSPAPFSWSAFVLMSLPAIAAIALYWAAIATARPGPAPRPLQGIPWWGWAGPVLIAAGWTLAWSGSVVPPEWRRHVFTPLWLGYILTMNALVYRRAGWSLLTHRTGWFLTLFPVSAVFWWLFEYLNQFTHNWYYTGIEARGDWDYFLQATLPFSTVLPAVASTWAWLRGFPRLDSAALPPPRVSAAFAWLALGAGMAGLAGIAICPGELYAMLWLAPLLVLCALQKLLVGETLLAPLARGDWRVVLQPALAGLICGVCWELWNYGSLAKWHYSVPYVERFYLFEMPLLGYAGYLPFGIECALVMDCVARVVEGRAVWPLDEAAR